MVGYHYQIRTDGTIEEGRPLHTTGAHAGPAGNSKTIGVVFSGDMSLNPPTIAQYETAGELHFWLEEQYGKGLEFYGHNDWMSTACPGAHTDLDVIRREVELWRAGYYTPNGEPDDPEERIRKQIEVEILEGRVKGKTTSGYLVIEEGRVYVPVRWVAEELGYDVQWHAEERLWEVK